MANIYNPIDFEFTKSGLFLLITIYIPIIITITNNTLYQVPTRKAEKLLTKLPTTPVFGIIPIIAIIINNIPISSKLYCFSSFLAFFLFFFLAIYAPLLYENYNIFLYKKKAKIGCER